MKNSCAIVLALLFTFVSASAARLTPVRPQPGPPVMSPEEAAIESGPEAGNEHAVILVSETLCREELVAGVTTSFHLRAKILSNRGRDLANVELPSLLPGKKLKRWWGRTILPDGTVVELDRSELERRTDVPPDIRSTLNALSLAHKGVQNEEEPVTEEQMIGALQRGCGALGAT